MTRTNNLSHDGLTVEELLDIEAIRAVLYRWCRAMDRHDAELLASAYWDDAAEWHGAFQGPAAEFCERALRGPSSFEVMRHSIGTVNVELEGDVARSEAYFVATGILRERRAGDRMLRVHEGRYIDRFERRHGEWRISRRTVVKDFIDLRPLNEPDEPYPASEQGDGDLVYRDR
jgi:ketosteroid isomerase-like protein